MDTEIVGKANSGGNSLPQTPEACRIRLAELKDEIAAADLARQAGGPRMDAGWFHRAKTALRHRQREVEAVTARLSALAAKGREGFKDALIAVLRQDYDDDRWRRALDEAHRRHAGGERV